MKDDVVKALEIHVNRGDCRDCPYKERPVGSCQKQMYTDLLEIFKYQEAEIERLKAERDKLKHEMSYMRNLNSIGDVHEMGAW